MLRATKRKLQRASNFTLESLEERQLLAWGDFPLLIDQDVAATKYPQYNGSGQVIVAMDSGINFWHPALANRIWTNPGEIPDNGIDDDNSGKVDDVNGWDFIENDNNPTDDQGHGTMVAGIMVANRWVNTGNRRGYAGDGREYQGIAPGAQVIPLRVANSTSYLDVYRVEAALKWVITNHKRYNITAINMSLGMSREKYAVIEDEMETLWNSGVFIAASSGNGGNTDGWMSYPAASPYAMSVGALNVNNTVNSITSRGSGLNILAPGSGVPYLSRGADYEPGGTGTSYSAPFIAAAGAVVKSVYSGFSSDQVLAILRDSGANVYDPSTGLTFKRLDLDNAIALALSRSGQTPTTPSTSGQTPFTTAPIAIPGYIQVEHFDNGGEGVSYHDTTAANEPGAYRNTGVDIAPATDVNGGYQLGYTKAGEWLEYTINVGATATYDIAARVTAYDTGGTFHIEVDGVNKTGSMTVPKTGSWGVWTTIKKTGVSLSAGKHVLRLVMDTAPNGYIGNFNWLQISRSAAPAVPTQSATSTIEAEQYDEASGIIKGSTGLSYVDAGDWVLYRGVDFGSGVDSFTMRIALADAYAGRQIQLRTGSANGPIIGSLTTRGTGGWGLYQEQTASIARTSGVHDLYLTFSGGDGVGNIDWFRFAQTVAPAPIPARSAFSTIEAESLDDQNGIVAGTTNISYVDAQDWVLYRGIDFGSGADLYTVRIALADAYAGRQIQLRTGSANGPIIGSLTTLGTGGWGLYREQTASIARISGVHDLYLTFSGGDGVGNIDWFRFA